MDRKYISLFLVAVSLGLLWPGVTQPMFMMDLKCKVYSGFGNLDIDVMNSSYSILTTVTDLFDRGKGLVGFLILSFSLLIPVVKALMFSIMALSKQPQVLLGKILGAISKWSMADVFVVAIFLVYLASGNETQAQVHDFSIMGMKLKVKVEMLMNSELLPGFYYFLAYCLVSILSIAIYRSSELNQIESTKKSADA